MAVSAAEVCSEKEAVLREALEKSSEAISPPRDGQRSRDGETPEYQTGLRGVRHQPDVLPDEPKLSDENEFMADWLVRLTGNQRNWCFRLCFLYLLNINRYSWSRKRGIADLSRTGKALRIKLKKSFVREEPELLDLPEPASQT